MRDESVYLQHVNESILLIEDYLIGTEESLQRDLFYEDQRTQDAALRRLEILADAASHLSDELTSRHREIPWRQIADFRNVLAHAYVDVRLDQVWNVIQMDLPLLEAVIETELR